MPRFFFRKLVRDKVVNDCQKDPEVSHTEWRVLDNNEYISELIKKISEEAKEIDAGASQDDALVELADLQEVVDAIREHFGFTKEQLSTAMQKKADKKGKFTSRDFIEFVDVTEDSHWNEIFRSLPDKYPEGAMDSVVNSDVAPEVQKGVYSHSKSGKPYEVVGVALHTETDEPYVVYRPLYEHSLEYFIRPYDMFMDSVTIDEEVVPRFKFIRK